MLWRQWTDRPWRNRLKSQSGCDLVTDLFFHRPLFWWVRMSSSLRRYKNLLKVASYLVQAQPLRRLQLPLSTKPLPRVVLVWLLVWPFIWLNHPTQVWSTSSTWFLSGRRKMRSSPEFQNFRSSHLRLQRILKIRTPHNIQPKRVQILMRKAHP